MLRMLRIRRYRLFLIFAGVVAFLLIRYSRTRQWEQFSQSETNPGFESPEVDGHGGSTHPLAALNGYPKDVENPGTGQIKITTNLRAIQTSPPALSSTTTSLAVVQTIPYVVLPDRAKPDPVEAEGDQGGLVEDIYPISPPGRQDLPVFNAVPTTIHWEKQVEHFPVPTESLIRLPTGLPATIPKIQHAFNDETTDAKINREKRQNKVREEFQKAWNGYKKYAWLRDELSPVTGKFRDPFCGWAATLVDTLDTLWIMGLQEEFEEAVRAVDLIDFTTSPRNDIPVFETTIRYLGGLLSAYDVSGGIYKNLLEKAVELAEILMGAFDTPNRMPVLFYRWKPTFASQPHRANQRSNLAELGSLSMEFTRLAQLTKDHRYYDAVARITNALSDWQDRGTKLDGVFPDNVDASGCNRSHPLAIHQPIAKGADESLSPSKDTQAPQGFEPSMPKTVAEPRPAKKNVNGGGPADLKIQIVSGEPSKARIIGWDDDAKGKTKVAKREVGGSQISNRTETSASTARDVGPQISNRTESEVSKHPITGLPLDLSGAKAQIGNSLSDWDCTPQGLEATSPFGRNKFSMGGGQDSTYEYFPKQYLLLAGREEKYKKMYLKTIDAVRKWMLYRPMVPGNHDILFSGSVTTAGDPETDLKLTAEVQHLTCFIGGMVGMGAKIFGIDGDLELAKRLADGCVWAYESTPSDIMPEDATVMPCENSEYCTWNETAYYEYLDPMAKTRDHLLEDYIENKALRDAEKAAMKEAAAKAEEERTAAEEAIETLAESQTLDISQNDPEIHSTVYDQLPFTAEPAPTSNPNSLHKRQSSPTDDLPTSVAHNFKNDVAQARENYKKETANDHDELKGVSTPKSQVMPAEKKYMEKVLATEAELQDMASGRQAEIPLFEQASTMAKTLRDPLRPLSHKEWVEARIKQDALPPGFVTIRGRKYILRPEAIESVWYMYRITGDSTWQDKGWKMFEAIIKATSATYGHSAIYDVTTSESSQVDEMESFWLAETLKYFYLLYSTPDTISLDEWVLNTEAHPFKREV